MLIFAFPAPKHLPENIQNRRKMHSQGMDLVQRFMVSCVRAFNALHYQLTPKIIKSTKLSKTTLPPHAVYHVLGRRAISSQVLQIFDDRDYLCL